MDEQRRTHRPLGDRYRSRAHLTAVPPPSTADDALAELRKARPSPARISPEELEALVTAALEAFRWSLAGGFRRQEHDDHVLSHALRAVGRCSGSVGYVSPYGLHVVFDCDPPDDPWVPTAAWRRLPFLLGAYVRHLHHTDEYRDEVVTLATLDEIDKWVAHWDRAVDEHGRRRSSRRPGWERELDVWAASVGGHDLLAALDAEPLPNEPLDLLAVDPAMVDRAVLVSSHCDRWFDPESELFLPLPSTWSDDETRWFVERERERRTAARRLVGRLARSAPTHLGGRARPESIAVAVCWAVEKGSSVRLSRTPSAGNIARAVGGSPSGARRRAHSMLEALDVTQPDGFLESSRMRNARPWLGSPDLLDSSFRGALLSRVGLLRCWLADPDEP
ncbi:MAG TPA: hypothetical protein VIY72_03875 [Acidimicrobiales bacterium]